MLKEKANDKSFDDMVITQVTESDSDSDAYWSIMAGSTGFGMGKEYGVEPKVGDKIRMYTHLGSSIHGIDINGEEVFYHTKDQQEEERKTRKEKGDDSKKIEFEKSRKELDAKFDSLPEVFQERIMRFRAKNPDFRWKFESYEIFVCTEAVKIAEALKTKDAIVEFNDKSYEEQKEIVSIGEGHSGNTFGMSIRLAVHYVTNPKFVELDHGALCPLVGCDDYGCSPMEGVVDIRK